MFAMIAVGSRPVGDRGEVIVELEGSEVLEEDWLGVVLPFPFGEDEFLDVTLYLVLLLEDKDTGKMVK